VFGVELMLELRRVVRSVELAQSLGSGGSAGLAKHRSCEDMQQVAEVEVGVPSNEVV